MAFDLIVAWDGTPAAPDDRAVYHDVAVWVRAA